MKLYNTLTLLLSAVSAFTALNSMSECLGCTGGTQYVCKYPLTDRRSFCCYDSDVGNSPCDYNNTRQSTCSYYIEESKI